MGQRMCPTGTMLAEIAYKTSICIRWAQAIYGCSLTRLDVYRAYNNVLIPQLSYTLPTTTINPKELKKLQTIVDQVYLPRIGLNRHFPQEMLLGPALYGGLEYLTFKDRQGIAHINLHIGVLRNGGDEADLLLSSLEYLQQDSGISQSVVLPRLIVSCRLW